MPTSSHLFYIPLVLLVGLVLGVVLGRRSILVQQAEAERRKRLEEARAARQASRSSSRAENGGAAGSGAGDDGG
jgi:hypothetical protein